MSIPAPSYQQALHHLTDPNKPKTIDARTRVELARSIQVLQESEISDEIKQKITEVNQLIQDYDKRLLNVLDKLVTLQSPDHFIIYLDKTGVKVETLNEFKGPFKWLRFKIRKIFRHNLDQLNATLQAAHLISVEGQNPEMKAKLAQSVYTLKRIRSIQREFYASKKSIARHAKLTTEINKILDLNLTSEAEKKIQRKLIKKGKQFLQTRTREQRFENLTGMSIASTARTKDNDRAMINEGGYAIFSTEHERKNLKKLLKESASQSPLSQEEYEKVKHYTEDLNRSRDLNFMLAGLSGNKDERGVRIAAKAIFDQILQLEEGQSIFLDVGYEEHAMRAQFTRKENELEIHLFDTSGALQFWTTKDPTLLPQFLSGKKQYVALATSVSLENFRQMGRAYLEQVILMDSKTVQKLESKKGHYFHYIDFLKVFRSINSKKILKTRHSIQKAYNCFAQRVRACEVHCLGISTYRKVRTYSLENIYDELWSMSKQKLDKEQLAELEKMLAIKDDQGKIIEKRRMLMPHEIKEIQRYLNRLEEFPGKQVEAWYPIFALLNHNILKHGYSRSQLQSKKIS